MTIILFSFLLWLSLGFRAQTCEPLYWETDPSFKVSTNECQYLAAQGLFPGDISETKGLVPVVNQTDYTISKINATVTYDNSRQTVLQTTNSVTVNGAILSFKFAYNVQSVRHAGTLKKYNGTATASFANMVVTYTKTASIKNGVASLQLTSANISTTGQVTPNGDYKPQPISDSDASEFDNLVKTNLTNMVVAYYKSNIVKLISDAIQRQGNNFPYPFDKLPYVYTFGGMPTTIDTSAVSLSLSEPTGYIIGYNGSVDKMCPCSQFVPDLASKASYITNQLSQAVFTAFYKSLPSWQNMNIDETNTRLSMFKFYMVYIQDILPSAMVDFPNLFDKLNVACSIDNSLDGSLSFDSAHRNIETTLTWNCGLFRTESKTNLLNFDIDVGYKVDIKQEGNALQTRVFFQELKGVSWLAVTGFPIANPSLAELYLRQSVSEMAGYSTVGSGFLQLKRVAPIVAFLESSMKISESNQL